MSSNYIQTSYPVSPAVAIPGQLMDANCYDRSVQLLEDMYSGDAGVLSANSTDELAFLRLPLANKLQITTSETYTASDVITGTVQVTDLDGTATNVTLASVTYATSQAVTQQLLIDEIVSKINASIPGAALNGTVDSSLVISINMTDYKLTASLTQTGNTYTYAQLSNDSDFYFLEYDRSQVNQDDNSYYIEKDQNAKALVEGQIYTEPDGTVLLSTTDLAVRFVDGGTYATRRGSLKAGGAVAATSTLLGTHKILRQTSTDNPICGIRINKP